MALTVDDLIGLLERYKATHAGGADDQVFLQDPNPFAVTNRTSFSSDVRWSTSLETGARSLILSTDTPEPSVPSANNVGEVDGLHEDGWPTNKDCYSLHEVTVPLLVGKTLDNTTFIERELPAGTHFLVRTFLDAQQNDHVAADDESYLVIRVQHELEEYQVGVTDFRNHVILIQESK
ncbi:hypothetical protein [Lacticaseibacillus sharpeae]|uniref:hypothetical protein n=1 Tax=Lacticaseibacillus sharpeae TaxID=1626 RepID=UPI0006D1A03D|nr:hypothetical protein [Lacticaseibacillus sharpeae]